MMRYDDLIVTCATEAGVDPKLITAQVMVESGGNSNAWNPEAHYRYFWNVRTKAPFRHVTALESRSEIPPPDFPCIAGDPDQEWWGQQASWGLMQIMGALARELGYDEPYLPALCSDPARNLSLGCLHMSRLLKWAHGDVNRALAAYNGGKAGNMTPPYRNQFYADKVLRVKAQL